MTSPHIPLDSSVRQRIYDVCLTTGAVPLARDVARDFGLADAAVLDAFRRLEAAHILVLQSTDEILMAMPFSAVPTPFVVRTASFSAFASCGWDALGAAAMLALPATILTSCPDCGDAITLPVTEQGVPRSDVLMHFSLPVRRWWESVVFT